MSKGIRALLVALAASGLWANAARAADETWTYAKRAASNEVALRPGYKTCADDKTTATVGSTVEVWKSGADKTSQCAAPTKVTLKATSNVSRPEDIKTFAFDSDPDGATPHLDVYLELKRVVDPLLLAKTKLRLAGTSLDATRSSAQPDARLIIRFEFGIIDAALASSGGQLQIVNAGVLDPETGDELAQFLDAELNWLLKSMPRVARFQRPQAATNADLRVVLPRIPLDRFVEPQLLECGKDKEPCTVSRTPDGLVIETSPATLDKLVPKVDFSTSGLGLMRLSEGHLVKAPFSVRLGLVECSYDIRQLSRVEAGRTQAQTLFSITRRLGSPQDCAEDQWEVIAKKPGSSEAIASGSGAVEGNVATVTWQSLPQATPNAVASYDLELKYRGGQLVKTSTVPKLRVEPALVPTANLRAFTSMRSPIASQPPAQWIEVTSRKALAVGRENLIELGAFKQLGSSGSWHLELIGASGFFPTCPVEEQSSLKRLCIEPPKATDAATGSVDAPVLQLRATETARAADCLLAEGDPSILPEQGNRRLKLGSLEFSTGFGAKPYRVAQDLEKYVSVACGERVIGAKSSGRPTSVGYDDFASCELVFGPSAWQELDAKQLVERYGAQTLEVKAALVPTDKSAPKLETLKVINLRGDDPLQNCSSSVLGARCNRFPLDMLKAAGGQALDYAVVQLEVKHVQDKYELLDEQSKHASELVVRVRRRPEFLTASNGKGKGIRAFSTFTIAPFSLFRAPHSGRNVWKSSDVAKLESAKFGAGILGVVEPWDFDNNSAAWPFLTPQFHTGFLSTIPSGSGSAVVGYPTVSWVVGAGLRTGVDTAPDATVESTLKALVWLEHLVTFDDRRAESSWNWLFGFGVDVGSFGN